MLAPLATPVQIAQAHRVSQLNNRVYCRGKVKKEGRRRGFRRRRDRKREQRDARVKRLQDLRRVIEHNRSGAKRLFQQADRCGDGTLGIAELRKTLKLLGLSITNSDCLAIIRSTRTRSTDSTVTVNYFTVLRAVRTPKWPLCGQPSALNLALGCEKPRTVVPLPQRDTFGVPKQRQREESNAASAPTQENKRVEASTAPAEPHGEREASTDASPCSTRA